MTDIAVVRDHLAVFTHVLAVVTTKATSEIKVPDVVRVRLPIGLHLREEISLEHALHFSDGVIDELAFLRVDVRIILTVKIVQAADRTHRLRRRLV